MSEIIEIEADSYSDDCKNAIVSCPKCAMRYAKAAAEWSVNLQGVFLPHAWYAFVCDCQQAFSFMLKFPLVQMVVGERYLVVRPAYSFGVIDGELVNFKEDRMQIEVLQKPLKVTMFDGETEQEQPLPEHLAKADWYRVRFATESKRGVKPFWLNTKGCMVTKANNQEG